MTTITANDAGVLTGSFTIPKGIPAGSKTVAFTGAGGSHGEAVFVGQGSLTVQTLRSVTTVTHQKYDPLAQTFTLEKSTQLAGVDLWFTAAGSDVRVQIREVGNGVPTRVVLAEAFVGLASIVVSGGGHTRVLFPAPVSLSANTEYAVVVLCDDAVTALSVAEMGKYDSIAQTWVSSQPYTVGVLLSSSNASTWTAHQTFDLAFRLLEAKYTTAPKEMALGDVEVSGATDMMLMALAEIPTAQSRVDYEVVLPNATRMTVAEGQPIRFATPVTGTVGVRARLAGTESSSPVLYPGSQLIAGKAATSAEYYSRAVVATKATKAVLVYDAVIPSGASVSAFLQKDSGEFAPLTADSTTNQGDGVVEYHCTEALTGVQLVKVKLVLSGTSTARPMVKNIRLMAAV